MKIVLECLPCMLRQVLEAIQMSTSDATLQHKIIDEGLDLLRQYKTYRNSPELCRAIHRLIKAHTGVADAYGNVKRKDIQTALKLYPRLKDYVNDQQDTLFWAIKIAAIGNVLDSGIYMDCDLEQHVDDEIHRCFAICDIERFKQQLQAAKSLLVIGDNSGETVLDCILLEQFPDLDIIYAVRSAPILNDATIDEAHASGLHRYARIISTGCDVPGVLLDECTADFIDAFHGADIVLAKGMGNFETLSGCGRPMYFLLKSKCLVVSKQLGVHLNDFVFKYCE